MNEHEHLATGEVRSSALVLFAEYTDLNPEPARALLASRGMRAELLELDAQGLPVPSQRDAVGIIAGYAPVTRELIESLPRLGIIATSSNGVDMVDLEAARARSVWVTNVGHAATEEVAVHTLTLMLEALRSMPEMTHTVRKGGWTDDLAVLPRRVSELTLGIVGFGRIGQQLASLAAPLFGSIIAYDPFASPAGHGVVAADLDELFAGADVISLHLPLTEETRGLVGEAMIGRMRSGAVLVNPSRGELIDEQAVLRALETGHLARYCADVLDHEPPAAAHPLRTHPRAIITPHAAFLSDAALRSYEVDPARYIAEWHDHGRPSDCIIVDPTRERES